jgi:hypothetical protein
VFLKVLSPAHQFYLHRKPCQRASHITKASNMGVHTLWSKVREKYSDSVVDFKEDVRRGSILLVDGWAFLFHLLNTQVHTLYKDVKPPFERQYGGNYRELTPIINLELDRLSSTIGFELRFYFDGHDSFFKGDTSEKRRKQLLKNWSTYHDVSIGDVIGVPDGDLPLPPLAMEELRFVLHRRNIKSIDCEFEADQELAVECYRLNTYTMNGSTVVRSGKQAFIYGMDRYVTIHMWSVFLIDFVVVFLFNSDFLVMKSCALITPESLMPFTETALAASSTSSSIRVYREISIHVWRRESVALLFGMTEDNFVDYCCQSLRNDFTSPNTRSDETANSNDGEVHNLDSDIATYELAVQYSKAFYNLEDLTEFYLMDEYRTSHNRSSLDDIVNVDKGTILLSSQRNVIRSWVLMNSNRLIKERTFSEKITNMFFREWKQNLLNNNGKDNDLFDVLSPIHLEVLIEMHGILSDQRDITFKDTVPMNWEDICAGHFYQLVARALRNNFMNIHDDCPLWQVTLLCNIHRICCTFHLLICHVCSAFGILSWKVISLLDEQTNEKINCGKTYSSINQDENHPRDFIFRCFSYQTSCTSPTCGQSSSRNFGSSP